MTRTPDEIKKGLECCSKGLTWDETCGTGCPYEGMGYGECSTALSADALALIQHKEQENAHQAETIERLNDGCHKLLVKIQQIEAERDAAVNALRLVQEKHEKADEVIDDEVFPLVDYDVYRRLRDTVDDMMNWEVESDSRGVQKEE